jgi:MYXO-CTERM domain-containing protein
MHLPLLRTAALAACLLCCGPALAQSGAVIDLTDVRLDMVSTVDGSPLPVAWRQVTWSLGNEVRSGDRVDAHHDSQVDAEYVSRLPTRVTSVLDSGSATVRIAGLFDDIHVATAFSGPTYDEHWAEATAGTTAFLDVPGHARLTLSGHLTVDSTRDPDRGLARFSTLFAFQGLVTDSFELTHANDFDGDFTIVADNTADGNIGFYQVTTVSAFGYAPPSPVPEPPAAAMLAAGVLVAGWRWRRRR